MWPYSDHALGDSFSVGDLRTVLDLLDQELVLELADDGRFRLSHRTLPEQTVAMLDVVDGGPRLEQLASYPGLVRDDVTAAWDECEDHVDPKEPHPIVARGPLLLTEIERGEEVDVYADAPPWEDKAVPTRSLKNDDVAGGWFIERGQTVFARKRVRIVVRRPPDLRRR